MTQRTPLREESAGSHCVSLAARADWRLSFCLNGSLMSPASGTPESARLEKYTCIIKDISYLWQPLRSSLALGWILPSFYWNTNQLCHLVHLTLAEGDIIHLHWMKLANQVEGCCLLPSSPSFFFVHHLGGRYCKSKTLWPELKICYCKQLHPVPSHFSTSRCTDDCILRVCLAKDIPG